MTEAPQLQVFEPHVGSEFRVAGIAGRDASTGGGSCSSRLETPPRRAAAILFAVSWPVKHSFAATDI